MSRRLKANADAFAFATQQVLESGTVLLGSQTSQFEKSFASFAGAKYGIAVSSGASALQLSLAALGIGPGDEVIVPAMTAVPTASAVCAVGARPVIVDIDDETAAIDLDLVEHAMTERTQAVIAVHLYGRPVDNLDKLTNLGVKVVEDCAQSHGATKGLTGSIGAYSFYPTKNLGGIGDGGMVVTDDLEVAERLSRLRVHGQSEQYVHIEVSQNHRMSEIEAAWLNIVLSQLEVGNQRRRDIANRYQLANPSIRWQATHPNHVYHWAVALPANRDDFRQSMLKRDISTGIHYPLALTQQPALQQFVSATCPIAENWASKCVSLPCFPELTDSEVDDVCAALSEFEQ
ncbi:MAG: DegT/DnrJ/EryC1/StrS family aminotransferase [Actinomycetes bacterium]